MDINFISESSVFTNNAILLKLVRVLFIFLEMNLPAILMQRGLLDKESSDWLVSQVLLRDPPALSIFTPHQPVPERLILCTLPTVHFQRFQFLPISYVRNNTHFWKFSNYRKLTSITEGIITCSKVYSSGNAQLFRNCSLVSSICRTTFKMPIMGITVSVHLPARERAESFLCFPKGKCIKQTLHVIWSWRAVSCLSSNIAENMVADAA